MLLFGVFGIRPIRVLIHISAGPHWLAFDRSVEQTKFAADELIRHLLRGLIVLIV